MKKKNVISIIQNDLVLSGHCSFPLPTTYNLRPNTDYLITYPLPPLRAGGSQGRKVTKEQVKTSSPMLTRMSKINHDKITCFKGTMLAVGGSS